MGKIKAVFYDLDNTLYPQKQDIIQRIEHCLNLFSVKNKGQIKKFWLKEWENDGPKKNDIIDRVIKEFSLKIDKELLLQEFRSFRTKIKLEPSVHCLLLDLKKMGIKQFLITNGNYTTQWNKIEELGLNKIFDELVIATGETAKPSDFWFKYYLNKYKLKPEETLMVGDWYEVDGIPAKVLGIKYLHLLKGIVKESLPPDIDVIYELEEIRRFIFNE